MKLILALLVAWLPLHSALLHDAMGAFERGEPSPFEPEEAAIFEEFE